MTPIKILPNLEIDGRTLYYSFISGAKKILENQSELNRINVFPVNDGDTGSNLASTLRSVIDTIQPNKSYKVTADMIADATLFSARGNSGIIFAQFIYGMSNETGDLHTITINQFADSIRNSVRYIYEAVANPVEGTMLTVIKDWADYVYNCRNKVTDFNQMMIGSIKVLEKSLLETTEKLPVLAKAKVVDAGAKGFVLFIKGIIEFIHKRNIRELLNSQAENSISLVNSEHISEKVTYRFCTEAVLKNSFIDRISLNKILDKYGDSVAIAGAEKIQHIHIHTNTPANLMQELGTVATLTFQKADDMIRQSEAVYSRRARIALVTDSTCDLPVDFFDKYQIHLLPINISFGENQYLDKVTINPEQFYDLLDKSPDYPKTSQITEKSFVNMYSHLASHYDSVISIHLTDKFSGTFYNSQKAAASISKEFNKPISVINSKNISGALGLIVLRIAQAIEDGIDHNKIVEMSERWIKDTSIFVSVKTLKYMVRGGRVSHFKGLIARILNINPIVSIDEDGKAIIFGKAFSQQSNMIKVMKHIANISLNRRIWNYVVLHANNNGSAEWYINKMKSLTGREPASVVNISPVIGSNAGVGAASVALMFD
jgi:uncharacterized protein